MGLVDKFTYLGSVVNKSNTLDDEVAHRLSSAAAAFHRLDACLWKSRHVSLRTKLAVFKVVVLPCLLYASETWTPLRRHVQPLEVFLNRCRRRILGVTWRDRVRTEELRARCSNSPIRCVSFVSGQAALAWSHGAAGLWRVDACPLRGVLLGISDLGRAVEDGGVTLQRQP